MAGQDDLDVIAADVEEGGGGNLAPANLQLPYLGIRHRDEIPRLGHEVGDARTR